MTWRTVVISSNSKLDLKLGYLVIRSTDIRKVHLSEISVLIIESTAVSLTSMLLCELCRRNIKVIFCDETHNPVSEMTPLYGCHDSPGKLRTQIRWNDETKGRVWSKIVSEKINCQADLLERFDYDRAELLRGYVGSVEFNDSTNREGHAAKVYFNTLFGDGFSRRDDCVVNSLLNYGYAILLSAVNREIVSLGYSTELGVFHDNASNHYNLGSDLMEPLRPLVDRMVLDIADGGVCPESKRILASILNRTVEMDGKTQYLGNALRTYVKSVVDSLDSGDISRLRFCYYESKSDETNRVLRPPRENC